MQEFRVAAYCRVSTDKSDQINSLENQIQYFTRYISAHKDWSMADVYYDEGISGTSTKKRNGFNQMMDDARKGKIDLILTKEVSRFARNTVDTLSYTRELTRIQVGVIFISDNIDTRDKDGELRLTIMASIAQEESRKTSERVKWGQKRRMEQGVVFGRDLLGYSVKEGKLILKPDEAETIKTIFHQYLHEGKGAHRIARELDEMGIAPKRATHWSPAVILRILRNEKYAGDLRQKKTYTPDYLSHEKKYNHGNEEKVYIKNHHEAIIDRDTWDSVQAELKRRSPRADCKRKHSNRYWCSGKIICGKCGRNFVHKTRKYPDGHLYYSWRCYSAATHGTRKKDIHGNPIGCSSPSINDKILLSCVAYIMQHIEMNQQELLNDILKELKEIEPHDPAVDIAKLYSQIGTIESKKYKSIDLELEGIITKDELKRQKEQYDRQIGQITTQIAKAKDSVRLNSSRSYKSRVYHGELEKILQFDPKNEILYKEVMDRIIVIAPDTVVVYLRSLPCGIKLQYRTSGKKERYSVQICRLEIIT